VFITIHYFDFSFQHWYYFLDNIVVVGFEEFGGFVVAFDHSFQQKHHLVVLVEHLVVVIVVVLELQQPSFVTCNACSRNKRSKQ